jgi:malonyl-CoA decarboxylase
MRIGRFAKNLFDSIADAGEKYLDLRRIRGTSPQNLLALCRDLVSHKGVASGLALARQLVNRYENLKREEKLDFLRSLNKTMGPDLESIKKIAVKFSKSPDEKLLGDLSASIASDRQKLFSRMIMAPNGTKVLVKLREDLIDFIKVHPELKPMDNDLRELLTSWFNPGFLELRKIDWNTEASILEKIIRYEAVHDIKNWNDLKQRLAPNRRCFAYFHPSLEDEPLIFVEIALTKGIPGSIQSIINESSGETRNFDTAIFYSINNCQKGLRKIPLGNFLIKMVVNELAEELPQLKNFSTLSPVPGFAEWLNKEINRNDDKLLSEKEKETLSLLKDENWHSDKNKVSLLKKPLERLCAHYLINEKRYHKPLDPVARFHFGNGAQLYRINWLGNTSNYGMERSFGLMVNYLYDLKQIEKNHEAYLQTGELAVSKSVRGLEG